MYAAIPSYIQTFTFGDYHFSAIIPNYDWLQHYYKEQRVNHPDLSFPYWAKVWNSSLALCHFLAEHPEYVKDKQVLELAAGLGLPSLMIQSLAQSVCCSDISEDAIALVQRSIQLNNGRDIQACVLDWNDLPNMPDAEIVLLSDVNYHEVALQKLYLLIRHFLENGSTIILTTPERIVARHFLQQLQSFQVEHVVQQIGDEPIHLYIYVNSISSHS